MRRITLVKKVLADGSPCRKCHEIDARLHKNGHAARIDRVVVADERDPDGLGWHIARTHGVDRAPFFLVETDDAATIYTVYLKFVRDVLHATTASGSESHARHAASLAEPAHAAHLEPSTNPG